MSSKIKIAAVIFGAKERIQTYHRGLTGFVFTEQYLVSELEGLANDNPFHGQIAGAMLGLGYYSTRSVKLGQFERGYGIAVVNFARLRFYPHMFCS